MNLKLTIFFLFPLLFPRVYWSQENFGVLNSNYLPATSVLINPSSMLDAKTRIDINIVSAHGFVMNNLAYIKDMSLRTYINDERYTAPVDYDFNLNRRKYHFYNRVVVQGPGFVFSQGDHAFGLGLGVKSYSHMRYAPKALVEGLVNREVPDDNQIKLNRMQVTTMTYGDIKLSYAYTFLKKKRELFMGGVSLSKFIPIQAAAAKLERLEAELLSDSTGLIVDMNSDNAAMIANKLRFMSGWGLDIGFTYQRMKSESFNYLPNSGKNNCRRNSYLYKIGVSLMDLGAIKFEEDDVEYRGVKTGNYVWQRETIDEQNPIQAIRQFEGLDIVTEDPTEAFVRKTNKVRLPTYLSLQGDYNVRKDKIYLNLTWVQRMPVGRKQFGVARANSIALTPRYESRFFEVSLPISLYEYKTPQVGLGLRFWFLVLGTDKLLPFLVDSDVYGADFYFSLRVPITYHPKCRDGKRDKLNYYPRWYRWKSKSCNGM